MTHVSLLVVFLMAAPLSAGSNATFGDFLLGAITPINPIVATNGTLKLNCTLSEARADDVYFRFGSARLPAHFVHTVDSYTAQLVWTDMQRISTGHVFCYVDDPRYKHSVDQVFVQVADYPKTPVITGCRVYNWDRMVCTWEPPEQDTGINTTQTLYWTLFRASCEALTASERARLCPWQFRAKCPHPIGVSQCMWRVPDPTSQSPLILDKLYRLQVNFANALGEASTVTEVEARRIVQPNAVSNFACIDAGRRHLTMKWTSPAGGYHLLLYRMFYRAKRTNSWQIVDMQTKNVTITVNLTDVLPGRNYTVRVKCIPLLKYDSAFEVAGFWSKFAKTVVSTRDAVLWVSPAVTAGSFHVSNSDVLRNVRLYWHVVPVEQVYGAIQGIRVRCSLVNASQSSASCPAQIQTYVRNATATSANVNLCRHLAYEVRIDANTTAGFNDTLLLPVVVIAAADHMPPSPDKFIAQGNRTGVHLHWTLVDRALEYMVFWCVGTLHDLLCKGELHWQTLKQNTTELWVPMTVGSHYSYYIFAISVQWAAAESAADGNVPGVRSGSSLISSGMTWSKCTFELGKALKAPVVKFSEEQRGERLAIEWMAPSCTDSGYVSSFLIRYCRVRFCREEMHEERVMWPTHDYVIENLHSDETYRVLVLSESPTGDVAASRAIEQRVIRSGLTDGQIAMLIIGALIVLSLIVVGMVATVRHCKKSIDKYKTLAIVLPQRLVRQLPEEEEDEDARPASVPAALYYMPNTSGQSHLRQNFENHKREKSAPHVTLMEKDPNCNGGYSAGAASIYSTATMMTSLDSADSSDIYIDTSRASSHFYCDGGLRAVPEEKEALLSPSPPPPPPREVDSGGYPSAAGGDVGDTEDKRDAEDSVYTAADISSYSQAVPTAVDPGYVTLPTDNNCNNNSNPGYVELPTPQPAVYSSPPGGGGGGEASDLLSHYDSRIPTSEPPARTATRDDSPSHGGDRKYIGSLTRDDSPLYGDGPMCDNSPMHSDSPVRGDSPVHSDSAMHDDSPTRGNSPMPDGCPKRDDSPTHDDSPAVSHPHVNAVSMNLLPDTGYVSLPLVTRHGDDDAYIASEVLAPLMSH